MKARPKGPKRENLKGVKRANRAHLQGLVNAYSNSGKDKVKQSLMEYLESPEGRADMKQHSTHKNKSIEDIAEELMLEVEEE